MFLSNEGLNEKVVICDSDRNFVHKLRDGFALRPEYLVCAIAFDGKTKLAVRSNMEHPADRGCEGTLCPFDAG